MQPRLEKEVRVQGGAEVEGMDSREEVDLQRQRQRLSGDTRVIAQEQTALSYLVFPSSRPSCTKVLRWDRSVILIK